MVHPVLWHYKTGALVSYYDMNIIELIDLFFFPSWICSFGELKQDALGIGTAQTGSWLKGDDMNKGTLGRINSCCIQFSGRESNKTC